jgi:hypothetical protein
MGPLRSMVEFLVCRHWLAHDPDRNWRLWMEQDHAARDRWRERLRQHVPALHDAAAASLTPEQVKEREVIDAVSGQIAEELGDQRPEDRRRSVEQMAAQVGLGFFYYVLYRYGSNVAIHPDLLAVDLLLEKHRTGLLLQGEPTAQFARPPVYLLGDHEALIDAARVQEF